MLIAVLSERDPVKEAEFRAEFEKRLLRSNSLHEDLAKHDRWWPTTRGST